MLQAPCSPTHSPMQPPAQPRAAPRTAPCSPMQPHARQWHQFRKMTLSLNALEPWVSYFQMREYTVGSGEFRTISFIRPGQQTWSIDMVNRPGPQTWSTDLVNGPGQQTWSTDLVNGALDEGRCTASPRPQSYTPAKAPDGPRCLRAAQGRAYGGPAWRRVGSYGGLSHMGASLSHMGTSLAWYSGAPGHAP